MARLVGLVVGVPTTEVPGYPDIPGVDNDVNIMRDLLDKATGLAVLDHAATVNAVHSAILGWHNRLTPGDTFVFGFSGHGAQRESATNDADGTAEALVLSDDHYPEAQLRSALHGFLPGVRVVALIDACHAAGTVFAFPPEPASAGVVYRRGLRVPGATSLTLAAAGEGETAAQPCTGDYCVGQLTDSLWRSWDGGAFAGTWRDLWDAASRWSRGLGYKPDPQAWLDGPDPDDEAILTAPALRP